MARPKSAALYRGGDGELIGRLVSGEAGVVPTTVFGAPLGAPTSWADAVAVLRERGLASLAEPWTYVRDDGEEVVVKIISAYPDRLLLVEAPWGYPAPDAPQHVVDTPTDRLRPRR